MSIIFISQIHLFYVIALTLAYNTIESLLNRTKHVSVLSIAFQSAVYVLNFWPMMAMTMAVFVSQMIAIDLEYQTILLLLWRFPPVSFFVVVLNVWITQKVVFFFKGVYKNVKCHLLQKKRALHTVNILSIFVCTKMALSLPWAWSVDKTGKQWLIDQQILFTSSFIIEINWRKQFALLVLLLEWGFK